MDGEHTTVVIQRYLDELAEEKPADPIIRTLLDTSVRRLHQLCCALLYRSYPRLTRPPLNLQVEEMLSAVVERRARFKCTAGLHHAVRHTAADTGFEHHGFLNVLLAVAAAADGADTAVLASLLAERDPQAVAARIAALDADLVADTRHFFTSFGTCSIEEPVADLVALGLAAKPG